jgi:hypothetical protein
MLHVESHDLVDGVTLDAAAHKAVSHHVGLSA